MGSHWVHSKFLHATEQHAFRKITWRTAGTVKIGIVHNLQEWGGFISEMSFLGEKVDHNSKSTRNNSKFILGGRQVHQ